MDFESVVEWNEGYPGRMSCQNGAELGYTPPSEFGGPKGYMSPEDAFVGSANMCFQIVFTGIARSLGIQVQRYKATAVGKLEVVDGVRKFVSISIESEIHLESPCDAERLQKAVDAAKRKCPVANSMDLEVTVSVSTS